MINASSIKKIQAEEKEVYGRKAKEKIEKKPENKIKNTDDIKDRQYLSLKEYNPPVVDYLNCFQNASFCWFAFVSFAEVG